jgi:glutamate synthase domain-containing protein 1
MCGIVGLLVKTPALREKLGELMVPMLIGMTERGPDSAGLAVFGTIPGRQPAQDQPVLRPHRRRGRLQLARPHP